MIRTCNLVQIAGQCLNHKSAKCFESLYTPNANMADHSVGARDELNGSEASEALMFCFDNAFQKSIVSLSIWSFCFVLPTRFCVPECHRNRVESPTAEKDSVLFSVFPFASEEKARGSRSPKECAYSVLKFRGWNRS